MQYFSKWTKLKRSTGWMLRFMKKCKRGLALTPVDIKYVKEEKNSPYLQKLRDLKTFFSEIGELNAGEIMAAEKLSYKKIQGEAFPEKIEISKNNISSRKCRRLYTLCCIMD
ncbi:hypothetical protein JTB14_014738 [Gonioctena quinquepunctata]|nr:hypothetical protein JTB14_014738 [Gonioctena quinquepunctata]